MAWSFVRGELVPAAAPDHLMTFSPRLLKKASSSGDLAVRHRAAAAAVAITSVSRSAAGWRPTAAIPRLRSSISPVTQEAPRCFGVRAGA